MASESKPRNLRVPGPDAGRVVAPVEIGPATMSAAGARSPQVLDDLLVGIQGLASPVGADPAEKAMLDWVPLGRACRVVRHSDRLSRRVGKGLKADEPGTRVTAVGAAGIGLDQEARTPR